MSGGDAGTSVHSGVLDNTEPSRFVLESDEEG